MNIEIMAAIFCAANDCLCYYDLSPLRGDSARRAQRLPLTRELSKISDFGLRER